MNGNLNASERAHVTKIKALDCSVCDAPGPSDAHHINQGEHWTVVALCKNCHQGSHNGWHGGKAIWRLKKMDELAALGVTIRRLML